MRCPFCDAASGVRETRTRSSGVIRRTRECYNGHRFTTEEVVYLAHMGRKPVHGHVLRQAAVDLDRRYRQVTAALAEGKSVPWVCERFGVSPRTVTRIRARARAPAPPSTQPGRPTRSPRT